MVNRHRSLLALCSAIAVLTCNIGVLAKERNHNAENQPQNSGSNHPQPRPLSSSVPTQKSKVQQESCADPKTSGNNSLCIEARSTLAAESQAFWARNNFWVGLGGTFAVALSLLATAWAAWVAQRSAEAAEKAISQARVSAEQQMRAYVGVVGGQVIYVTHSKIGIRLKIRNAGTTPASDVSCAIWFCFGKVFDEANIKSGATPVSNAVFLPGQEENGDASTMIGTSKSDILFVSGRIFYRDAFSERRETNFRYIIDPTDETFRADFEGNYMT